MTVFPRGEEVSPPSFDFSRETDIEVIANLLKIIENVCHTLLDIKRRQRYLNIFDRRHIGMDHFAFDLALAFLLSCIGGRENMGKISRILLVFQNKTCVVYCCWFISEICNSNSNIPIIFTGLDNNYIILLCKTHFFCQFGL